MNHCTRTISQPLWAGGAEAIADLNHFVGANILIAMHMHSSFSGTTVIKFETTTEDASGDPDAANWSPVYCGGCDGSSKDMEFTLDASVEPFATFGASNTATSTVCFCCIGEGQRYLRIVPDNTAGFDVQAIESSLNAINNS